MPQKPSVFLCKSHPDFHIPDGVDVGADFDADSYVAKVKGNGADALVFFAKCHFGNSYYPTNVGTVHPGLKCDMFGGISKACDEQGLGFVAYYSVFYDTVAIEKHPDWELVSADAKTDAGYDSGNFRPVCVNSPYLEKLLIPQCQEFLTQYSVDELLFDTMTGFTPCYCDTCREKFGNPIPESNEDPSWLDYVKWYAACYEDFFAKATQAVHDAAPHVSTYFNWVWSYKQPYNPVPHIGRLAADLIPAGEIIAMVTKYFAGTGYPFDFFTGRFLHGLGDWNNQTPETLKFAAAATVANGGSFYLIDRQLPDGSMEDRAYDAMKDVFGFLQERRDVLCGATHVPETALLHSYTHLIGDDMRYFPDAAARADRLLPYEGAIRMFMENSRHLTALNEERLQERIADYKLVIVPETEFLSPELKQTLFNFVENGGRLLITQSGDESQIDRDILDFAGVETVGHTEAEYGYFEWPGNGPILLRGRSAQIKPKEGTEELVRYVEPQSCGTRKTFGHGFAPPGETNGYAAATSRKVGKGEVIYVASPLFRAYQQFQTPQIKDILFSLMDRLLPEPVFKIETPAQVEATALRQGNDLLVHLVNNSGKVRLGDHYYPSIEYMPEIRDIRVSIKRSNTNQTVEHLPSGQKVEVLQAGAYASFIVPSLEFLESFRIAGSFK